jgi:hypothetical protein
VRGYVAGLGLLAIWGAVRGWGGYWPLFLTLEQQLLEVHFTLLDVERLRNPATVFQPDVWGAYQTWLRVRWPFRAVAEARGWARIRCIFFYFRHPRAYFAALIVPFLYKLAEARRAVRGLPSDIRAARSAALER